MATWFFTDSTKTLTNSAAAAPVAAPANTAAATAAASTATTATTANQSAPSPFVHVDVRQSAFERLAFSHGSSAFHANSCFDSLDAMLAKSRRFSLDLLPRVVFSRSTMIDALVRSGVNRYLEFKCLNACYMMTDERGTLTRVERARTQNIIQ